MITEITLDKLNEYHVSIKTESFILENGKKIKIGTTKRITYYNNAQDREKIKEVLDETYQNAVFAVWGDTPISTEQTE